MNQLHISDRISVLLNHVVDQEGAVNCLQEIFRNNDDILKTKIHQQEITYIHGYEGDTYECELP